MAGLIPEAFVQDVLDRSDLVQVIGSYVKLKKAGSSYKGLCPFHQEKTPSFHVHPDRGFFYCFGCQKGGDSIQFLRQLHGYSFQEAIENLAERLGLEVPTTGGEDRRTRPTGSDRKKLLDIHRLAQEYYVLQGTRDAAFSAFLKQRSLSGQIAERFGLGLALDGWDGLTAHLRRGGADHLEVAVDAGLLVPRQSGQGHYDRFRHRVMFPVHDVAGAVVAYSGRTLERDVDAAKYVNSPETRIYRKGKVLFGLYQAKETLRKTGSAILVEGNVDVVRLHDCGFTSAIAPLGTAMTLEQAKVLARFVTEVTLFYDGDSAGEQATMRAIPILFGAGLDVRVARPEAGRDPDDLLDDGRDSVELVVSSATPALHYLVQALRRQHGSSPAATGRIVADAMESIAAFPEEDSAVAAAWKVYRILGLERTVQEQSVRSRIRQERQRKNDRGRRTAREPATQPVDVVDVSLEHISPMERQMGALLVRHSELAPRFVDDGGLGLISSSPLETLIAQLAGLEGQSRDLALQKLTADLLFGVPFPSESVTVEELYHEMLVGLEMSQIERKSLRLQGEIDAAEQSGDKNALQGLRSQKLALVRRRLELQSAKNAS